MMGRLDSGQDKLFHSFNLDSHVPQTHLLRGIDQALNLGLLSRTTADDSYFTAAHCTFVAFSEEIRLRQGPL
jgi:hypothetical protein